MLCDNLLILRKRSGMTQEVLAERLGISRQTLAKWENGESVPDVLHCDALAEVFQITLDGLLHADLSRDDPAPKGKFIFGTVTVGDKGQIVIPVKARRTFGIQPGDSLIVLGDIKQGLALIKSDFFIEIARTMQEGNI